MTKATVILAMSCATMALAAAGPVISAPHCDPSVAFGPGVGLEERYFGRRDVGYFGHIGIGGVSRDGFGYLGAPAFGYYGAPGFGYLGSAPYYGYSGGLLYSPPAHGYDATRYFDRGRYNGVLSPRGFGRRSFGGCGQ